MLLKFKCDNFFQFFILASLGLLTSCKPDPFFENKIIGEVNFLSTSSGNELEVVDAKLICKDKKTNKYLFLPIPFQLTNENKQIWIPNNYENMNCKLEIDSFIYNNKKYTPPQNKDKKSIPINSTQGKTNTHVYETKDKTKSVHFTGSIIYNTSNHKFDVNFNISRKSEAKFDKIKYLNIDFSKKHKDDKYFYIIKLINNSTDQELIFSKPITSNLDFLPPLNPSVSEFFTDLEEKLEQCYNKNNTIHTKQISFKGNNNNKKTTFCVLVATSDNDIEFDVDIEIKNFKKPFSLQYNPSTGLNFLVNKK
ncbi:hypothetical protein [Spirobacillus cienkowskii]|uniref:hypothetical protein n=1 Tax=Spirobacillus cienkowskii TaxID=495820 RepID=UPI0030CDB4B3